VAEQAARRTFGNQPSLPLERPGSIVSGPLQDQRRLSGAFFIKIEHIRPDPDQPRKTIDPEHLKELIDNIRQFGILQPISVRFIPEQEAYFVIAGERRYRAAKEAGLTELPCWVQTPKSENVLLQQIAENWQRRDLEPLELAEALAVLRDTKGYSQKQLSQKLSKPESEISRLLSLLKLEPKVLQTARSAPKGTFTKRHLGSIAQLPPEDQQDVMVRVQDRMLTATETEEIVREKKESGRGIRTRGAPRSQRHRYVTDKATVIMTFHRRNVTVDDLLATLAQVRDQIMHEPKAGE
jgi:ParB family transcriptional regulator, chromosome partitioning protein